MTYKQFKFSIKSPNLTQGFCKKMIKKGGKRFFLNTNGYNKKKIQVVLSNAEKKYCVMTEARSYI
jgi:hypothetical protein